MTLIQKHGGLWRLAVPCGRLTEANGRFTEAYWMSGLTLRSLFLVALVFSWLLLVVPTTLGSETWIWAQILAQNVLNLCNQPLKGYPRIKKRQKIGPEHK